MPPRRLRSGTHSSAQSSVSGRPTKSEIASCHGPATRRDGMRVAVHLRRHRLAELDRRPRRRAPSGNVSASRRVVSSHSGRICTIGPLRLLLNSRPSSSRSQKRRLPTTPRGPDVDLVRVDEPQRLHRGDRDADDLRLHPGQKKNPDQALHQSSPRTTMLRGPVTSTPLRLRYSSSAVRRGELDLDLARRAGVVRRHRREIGQRPLRAVLDQLAGALRRDAAAR